MNVCLLSVGLGEGQGEVEEAVLLGVDWAEAGPLDNWEPEAPNRSPSRSVVVFVVVGGCEEVGGGWMSAPSRPRRSTSSAGGGAAAGGASTLLAPLAFSPLPLLCWLESESMSSSEGSLSSFGPTRPPWAPWVCAGSKQHNRYILLQK